jgi:hypothetical protein
MLRPLQPRPLQPRLLLPKLLLPKPFSSASRGVACLWMLSLAACGTSSPDGLFGPRASGGTAGSTGASNSRAGAGGDGGSRSGTSGAGGGAESAGGQKGIGGGSLDARDAGELDAATIVDTDAGRDAGDGGVAARQLSCAPRGTAQCNTLITTLRHRYSFDGTGTSVADTAGGASGSVRGAQLSGSGSLDLDAGAYVNLPNGVISSLTSVTLEAWLNWAGGAAWQRIFDFGSTTNNREDVPGAGSDYLFLTPQVAEGNLRVAFRSADNSREIQVDGSAPLSAGIEQHVAVVVDGVARTLALYVNGNLAGSTALPSSLSAIHDVNDWLGRSQFQDDPAFSGRLIEFRIYGAALDATQIGLSFQLGPDAPISP